MEGLVSNAYQMVIHLSISGTHGWRLPQKLVRLDTPNNVIKFYAKPKNTGYAE